METNNYKWLRSQFTLERVDRLPDYGSWVTVSIAASLLKKSSQTIRLMYLKGKIKAIKFNASPILVDISRFIC